MSEPRWIPVTERLPESGKRVIACVDVSDVCIAAFYPSRLGEPSLWLGDDDAAYSPSHWMPIPELPMMIAVRDDQAVEVLDNGPTGLRITDDERHAIGYAISVLDDPRYSGDAAMAETMRGLLKRHGYDVT